MRTVPSSSARVLRACFTALAGATLVWGVAARGEDAAVQPPAAPADVSAIGRASAPDPRDSDPSSLVMADEQPTSYGLFYDRYEPTFYTGFAPRALDPARVHLQIGRGNVLRATVVLSDEVLESYARDLLARYQTIRSLIDGGEMELTQNAAFEPWERRHQELDLAARVAVEDTLAPQALREQNLALMEQLNPGRVFRIRIPLDELVLRWMGRVTAADRKAMDRDRQVELLDALLPTRIHTDRRKLDAGTREALRELVALVPAGEEAPRAEDVARLRPAYEALLQRVSGGRYPVRGDQLEFAEFTALYPIGSLNQYTKYRGREIPLYPTPGRRDLMIHQRTRTIDHIPTVVVYSYSPWIPYMHVGSRMHNSFHTLWWKLRPEGADFLPEELRTTDATTREGKPYRYLWLLSRGPMSHGCTHVNAGHIAELRQLLPAEIPALDNVEVFINKSYLYDVFDIDGDLEPEVMGVKYFVAYSLRNKKPHELRAPNERRAFYDWLYGGEVKYEADGSAYLEDVEDAHFVGAHAARGESYDRIRLYEAEYEPERVQFYAERPIPFVREVRKVGFDRPFSRERASRTTTLPDTAL